MREIKPDAFTVFKLDELDDDARQKAIEQVSGLLTGEWWDSDDMDQVSESIAWKFGNVLGTPGDPDSVPGVKVEGWDVGRGQYVAFKGELTPENAPNLPWVDDIYEVRLYAERDHTRVCVMSEEPEESIEESLDDAVRRMDDAVADAIHEAWKSGRDHMEHVGSEEYAVEHIEANEREFHADGSLYG